MKIKHLFVAGSLLSQTVAWAQSAQNQTTTAAASAKTFYQCLIENIGSENYNWAVYTANSIPQEITANMKVDDIVNMKTVSDEIKKVIVQSVQSNVSRFLRTATANALTQPGFNFQTEFTQSLLLLNQDIKQRLMAYKNENFTEPVKYRIMIAPRVSAKMLDRLEPGEVLRNGTYSSDRIPVYENLPDSDNANQNFDDEILNQAYRGIGYLAQKAVSCTKDNSAQPYFVSASLEFTINPAVETSTIKSQLVVGMPMGMEIPFEQANDQVKFTKVKMPLLPDTSSNYAGLATTVDYPMAFVNTTNTLNSDEMNILVQFGTIGNYSSGKGWQRSLTTQIQRTQVPRLIGQAVGNSIKEKIGVDFSIFNLVFKVDMRPEVLNQSLKAEAINLYLSAGLSRFPNYRFGMFNKTDVDQQFTTEVNKTIVAQIDQQSKSLKDKALTTASQNTGLSQDQIQEIIKSIFSNLNNRQISTGAN